jgi:transposase
MPACLIGMDACVGAHHLSRQLLALGHDVKLIPAQFVIPFRKSHKNDFRDAEAIAEAVLRPTMRFVPSKTVDQFDPQALHRVRSRLVSQRTAVVNRSGPSCSSAGLRWTEAALAAPGSTGHSRPAHRCPHLAHDAHDRGSDAGLASSG